MKIIFFTAFLFTICATGHCRTGYNDRDVARWSAKLLQEKSIDTTEFYSFADTCIKYGKIIELMQTYKSVIDAGQKDLQPGDVPFLKAAYNTLDTVNPTPTNFYPLYFISRIYIKYHIDNVLPLLYANAALAVARKLNNDDILVAAYKNMHSYNINIKHDLLSSYEWLKEEELLIQKSTSPAIKIYGIGVNSGYATIYYYLSDNEKGVEYINKAIALAKYYHVAKSEFNLYMVRSAFEMEMNNPAAVFKTLDTADIIARKLPNSEILLNDLRAQRFNAYEAAGNVGHALSLSKTITLDALKGISDDYYDYLYHLIRLCMKEKKYDLARSYLEVYMSELKSWNLQRLTKGYELQYILGKETNDNASALKYYILYKTYNDSIHHSAKNAAVIKEQIKYQNLQKDQALKLEVAENKIKTQTIKFIVAGSVTIFLLLLLLLAFRINKNLREKERLNRSFAQQLIQNTEQEQNRLANELHDGLGQELLLLKNSLLQHQDGKDADKVGKIIESVRGMARELYPALLEVVGLKAAIENQLEKIDHTEQIFVSAEIEFDGKMDKDCQLQFYRIFQEAITNILKYSGATSMYVGLTEADGRVIMKIKDNGAGFNVAEKLASGASFGLVSMQKRADAINGLLSITSSGKGTEITISILKNENNNS